MTDFATLATELANHTHRPGDVAAHKNAIVQALRKLRTRRVIWGEGGFFFVVESGVNEYPEETYPRVARDIMALTSVETSYNPLATAVISPDTLVSSTNLTGTITALQDSAENPDDDYQVPATAANTDFVARWDVDLTRPLNPGANLQIMRLLVHGSSTTSRQIDWTLKEGANTRASGNFNVTSSSRIIHDIAWDASALSTLNPSANQISLTVADSTGAGEVSFGALQWFTNGRDSQRSATGGTRPLEILDHEIFKDYTGGRVNIVRAVPRFISYFDKRIWVYPTPNGSYLLDVSYMKDSTRDEETGNKITTSSTTETNGWFDEGYAELRAQALVVYHATRTNDPKALAMAQTLARDLENTQHDENASRIFSGYTPKGYF